MGEAVFIAARHGATRESLTSDLFLAEWSRCHEKRPPIAWLLRTDESLPWVRFHALPDSKRYAEDDAEHAEILFRANELSRRVLGPDSRCWFVRAFYGAASHAGDLVGKVVVQDERVSVDDETDLPWHIYVQATTWRAGEADELLTMIADDREGPCLWMARETGAIFAPYDGGFDLFPGNTELVAILKADHPDWLSTLPSGL